MPTLQEALKKTVAYIHTLYKALQDAVVHTHILYETLQEGITYTNALYEALHHFPVFFKGHYNIPGTQSNFSVGSAYTNEFQSVIHKLAHCHAKFWTKIIKFLHTFYWCLPYV